jgi:hypothetical protein
MTDSPRRWETMNGTDDVDRLEEAVRQAFPDRAPDAEGWQLGEARVRAAIESPREPRLGSWASTRVAAAVLLVGVTALVVAQALRPSPAEAAITELIQRIAAQVDPASIPEGRFAYTRSHQEVLGVRPGDEFPEAGLEYIAYLVPSEREVWVGEGVIQIRTTAGRPRFFSQEAEEIYWEHGLDAADQIGETVTVTQEIQNHILGERDWSPVPQVLAEQMRAHIGPNGDDLPDRVELFNLAAQLLRESGLEAAFRRGVLTVLAGLDLELVERRADGGVTLALTHNDPLPTRVSVTLNGHGFLVEETQSYPTGDPSLGIPQGAVIYSAVYQPTEWVERIGA